MLYQTPSVVKLEFESLGLKSQGTLPPDCSGNCPNQADLGFTCENYDNGFVFVEVSYFVPGGSCINDEQSAECQIFVNGDPITCDEGSNDECNLETCGSERGALVVCTSFSDSFDGINDCGDINSVTVKCTGGGSDECADESPTPE